MALVAGPASAATGTVPCALPRTEAHHSLGTDTWNADYPRPEGSLDAAMIFLAFPDARPSVRPRQLAADHFPATSDFFDRASYGRFTLRPHTFGHWIRMPAASTSYGIHRDWEPELRGRYLRDAVAAADPYVDFSRYDVIYLVADPDARGVNSDATKVVNLDEPLEADGSAIKRLVTVFEQSPPDRHVLAHETGHVFDLPDLYHRPDGDGAGTGTGDWDTYVGDWDLMGSQFGLAPEPFAWHKWKLGWLGRPHVDCVAEAEGSSTHTLYSLDRTPLGTGGEDKRLAVVRTGAREALAVEVRGTRSAESGMCHGGVLLYWVRSDRASTRGPIEVVDGHPGTRSCADGSVYPALADAPLGEGESFATERGGGVRVEVTGRGQDGGWDVRITRGPLGEARD
ncbi:M6 family metalloprotease domain-containing protein [Streptomyces sp. HNM0574]|uniref:M6 family metalloprotease domain-containing protein n=1 Tax=Streptomyces sp. HNM0574 TaxID=2714954 RepID=UPI00146F7FD8|nr:M6 family metalloprotease domain-containing protein [Streptomyces sp. HNM0574]NLU66490.1 M6 family metalloprotease domain-containing protein [Streptomyces sp. HNM0574]